MSNFLDMDLMIKIDAKTSRPFDLFEVIFQKGLKKNKRIQLLQRRDFWR